MAIGIIQLPLAIKNDQVILARLLNTKMGGCYFEYGKLNFLSRIGKPFQACRIATEKKTRK